MEDTRVNTSMFGYGQGQGTATSTANARHRMAPETCVLALGTLLACSHLAATVAPPIDAFDTPAQNQLGLTFSPDGRRAFWVAWNGNWGSSARSAKRILSSSRVDGVWSEPSPMPFTDSHSDDDPFVSPDGRWLYFISDRPSRSNDEANDANIWRYDLSAQGQPEYLSINSESAEFSPVVVNSGALYFASNRDRDQSNGDLFRALPSGQGFSRPRALGPALNSNTGEWNLWVAADELEIIFEASSRATNVSVPGDLYYSWHTAAGWTPGLPISQLNGRSSDLMPRLHPAGARLYYTSAEGGSHARILSAAWQPLREELQASFAPILLVANRASHDISVVDLALGREIKRLPTGEGPHLLSNVSQGRLLATGFGEFPQPHEQPVSERPPFVTALNSRLTLIDTVEHTVLLDTPIADCDKPHASWLIGALAYVSCEQEQRVAVLDLRSGAAVSSFPTQQHGSHVLAFEPGSRVLSVSNTASGSVTLINIDSGQTELLPLAAGSEGARVIAGKLWVANARDGSISVVDPQSAKVIEHISDVCQFPIAIDRESNGPVWVACFASSELVAINAQSFSIERRIDLPAQPLNLLTHRDRSLAYVSTPRDNAIAEIDLWSGRIIRHISVGMEPDGLRWATP